MNNDQTADFANEVGKLRVLMEQTLHEVQAVHELVGAQPTLADFHRLEDDVAELKGDMKTDRSAVADLSDDVTALWRQSGLARPGHMRRVG